MKRFSNRSVVVTGASSGLGKALAIALAQEGAELLLCARRTDRLHATAQACMGKAVAVPGDPATTEYCIQLHDRVRAHFTGGLDYLVACAGQRQWRSINETTPEDLMDLMEANYFGTTRILHHLKPLLQGTLVCAVTSVQGSIPVPEHAAYTASKHALDAYLQVLRMETPIEVLVIRPGWIDPAAVSRRGAVSEAHCVRRILEAMLRRRRELYIPARYRLLPLLKQLCPRTFEHILRRRIQREAHRRGLS